MPVLTWKTLTAAAALLALAPALTPTPGPAARAQTPGYRPDQGEASMTPALPPTLSPRQQAAIEDRWLARRLDTLVPALMREHGIDMWVLVAREYMEDPVVSTMLNATSLRARRRTILLFHDPGDGQPVERLTVSRYDLGDYFKAAWDPDSQPDQWQRLAALIAARDPDTIALNVSPLTAFADGLTHSQHQDLLAALPERLAKRIVPGFPLAIGWLETRTTDEMAYYPHVVRTAHAIIGEGLSRAVITPDETSAADVQWWYRQRIARLGLDAWFHPSVAVIRRGEPEMLRGDVVIRPGDMLWTDFGIVYLGLNTDTQHLGYVLRPGETEAPAGLRAGLAAANRVQDALTASFRLGDTGNEILARARARAIDAGLEPSIYSHPIGFHGHGAGASIGFWDNQGPAPKGEYRLRADTAWSIELNATLAVPEWGGQRVEFRLEEDAFFDGETVRYIDGRQTRFHLIAPF
ncbi:Xaa-Pro aminopeptidase [Rhodothalassium salexigens DSM 2132]|nr:Xaa-Pro aminopeptidase [Rhodothalassium salexigens DSM 2132]